MIGVITSRKKWKDEQLGKPVAKFKGKDPYFVDQIADVLNNGGSNFEQEVNAEDKRELTTSEHGCLISPTKLPERVHINDKTGEVIKLRMQDRTHYASFKTMNPPMIAYRCRFVRDELDADGLPSVPTALVGIEYHLKRAGKGLTPIVNNCFAFVLYPDSKDEKLCEAFQDYADEADAHFQHRVSEIASTSLEFVCTKSVPSNKSKRVRREAQESNHTAIDKSIIQSVAGAVDEQVGGHQVESDTSVSTNAQASCASGAQSDASFFGRPFYDYTLGTINNSDIFLDEMYEFDFHSSPLNLDFCYLGIQVAN